MRGGFRCVVMCRGQVIAVEILRRDRREVTKDLFRRWQRRIRGNLSSKEMPKSKVQRSCYFLPSKALRLFLKFCLCSSVCRFAFLVQNCYLSLILPRHLEIVISSPLGRFDVVTKCGDNLKSQKLKSFLPKENHPQ